MQPSDTIDKSTYLTIPFDKMAKLFSFSFSGYYFSSHYCVCSNFTN